MEIKENSQKKVLLSVLGVAILVVAVVGISFAAYQATVTFDETNSVSTGTIMVSYTEPTNAINITDAMPLSDANGMALSGENKTFDFTVSTRATNALTVPYVISLTRDASSTLANNEVKVYLTHADDSVVTDVTSGKALGAALVSSFGDHATRANTVTLATINDVFAGTGEAAKVTNYRLRLWVDENVAVSADSNSVKSYKALVNVDSAVKPVQ